MKTSRTNFSDATQTPGPPPRRTFLRLRTVTLALVLLLSLVALFYVTRGKEPLQRTAHTQEGKTGAYYCPMHPSYHSDKPGNCPICGMKFVRMEKPGAPTTTTAKPESQGEHTPSMAMNSGREATPQTASPSANAVYIAPQKQQLIGMHSVPATVQALTREIRTVGKVAYDETKVTHIHTKVSGYIEEVYADYIGKAVSRGDALFTIYSPDLLATQEEYLLALKSRNTLKNSAFPDISRGSDNLLAATRERLRLWDVTPEDIRRLEQGGAAKRAITVYSPISGIVTERKAYHHGTFVDPEMELFTIVDLSRVWVLGEVYEYELPFVHVGETAEVSFPYGANPKTLRARISFISPFLDPKTRTAEIRLEFSNPGLALKPDMFTNVILHASLGKKLTVPEDAVLNTGAEQYVFLDLGDGYVEPRLVEVGPAAGGSYAILKGIKAGDRVVTAANFIVDTESRLKGAFANLGKPTPVNSGEPKAPEQNLIISLLEPKQAKVGPNALRLSVKDSSGKPVDAAEVEISLFMPQMGSMAPMTAKATLLSVGGGDYTGTVEVPMAWTWQTTVIVKRGKEVLGSLKTNITAR